MRILAFLLLSLSLAAYRSQKTTPDRAAAPACNEQTTNILYRSIDGGKTWLDISRGLPKNPQVSCLFAQGGEVYLGGPNGSLYHSNGPEMGLWDQEDVCGVLTNLDGMSQNESVSGLYPGRSGPYAVVSLTGFYRKIPGSNIWKPMHETLQDKTIATLLETSDGAIVLGCSTGIYKSTDDGKSWKHVFSEGWIGSLIASNGALVAGGAPGLLRSTDGGEHWSCVLPDKDAFYTTRVIGGQVAAVRVAGPMCTQGTPVDIPLRTSADGQTWQRMYEGGTPFRGIYDLQQAGKYLFCCHSDSISRSADGGKTWELVRSANPDRMEHLQLVVSGETIYVAVLRGGC